MRREVGSAAGILAILAVVLHTAFPTALERGGASSAAAEKAAAKKGGAAGSGDEPPEGPWLATRSYFQNFEAKLPQNDEPRLTGLFSLEAAIPDQNADQLRKMFGVAPDAQIDSVIAAVPDPLHTRLALHFDGVIDALERAAEQQGWTFSKQWLPWLDPANLPDDNINERRLQRRLQRQQEAFPGILVFRGDTQKRVLFVFLVPDSPTGGIAGDSFAAALNLASVLPNPGGPMNEIGLLAPVFSGSFPSLARLLNRWTDVKDRKGPKLHNTVFGGQVSSYEVAKSFTESVRGIRGLAFHGGITNSDDYRYVFECGVLPSYHLARSQAAYLVEGETGYGLKSSAAFLDERISEKCPQVIDSAPIRTFTFPRDLAHVRNAFREASQGVGTQNPGLLPSVDFTLKDPTRGEDSIPTFSETGNSMTGSASLDLLMEELQHQRIRIVYIVATNPLDMIFVTQWVRRESPDTRILVGDDPSILFLPAASQESLTGTLFLATYPMSYQGNQWLTPSAPNNPLAYEQGVTNAAQLLLARISHTKPQQPRGYGRLETNPSAEQFPGLWLLTLTRSGFLPVDWFDASENNLRHWFEPFKIATAPPGPGYLEERFPLPEPSLGWYFTTWGVSIGIFAACFFLVLSNGKKTRPLWLALTDNYRARIPVLAGACLSLSALEWILLFPAHSGLTSPGNPALLWTLLGSAVAFLAPLASGLWVCTKASSRTAFRGKCPRFRDGAYLTGYALIYAVILALWAQACGDFGPAETPSALLFRLRSLQLYSGASPALPLVLLSCLFFATFMNYFYRFTQAGMGRPRLSIPSPDRLQKCCAAVEKFIMAPAQLPALELGWRWGVCGVLTGMSIFAVWGRIRPMEQESYHWALSIAITASALALALGCYDLWFTWRNFKRMLKLLRFDPLEDAFRRVSQSWPRRPVWGFWRSVPEAVLAAQMTRALRNRCDAAAGAKDSPRADFEQMRAAAQARFATGDSPTHLSVHETYQQKIASLARQLWEQDLKPHWDDSPGAPAVPEPVAQASADFVALQYCNYLVYAARQIQRVAWGVTLLLVMLTLILNSYSPQGPLVVGRFVACIFVLVGVIVVGVFAGMERDPILSRIARTNPGELNAQFWFQITAMGLLPAIGVLVHLFPSLATFLSSWVAPTLDAGR